VKYRNAKLRQMLAAEYALGTLRGGARRRFERLVQEDAAIARELRNWERRLGGLHARITPAMPREVVWAEIERRVSADRRAALPAARRLREPRNWVPLWRGWAMAATLASIGLGYGLWQQLQREPQVIERLHTVRVEVPQPMPYVAMLQPDAPANWVVLFVPGKRMLKVSAAGNFPVDPGTQDLQLWVLDDSGTPHSMGMLPEAGLTVEIPMPEMPMPARPVMAVSVEPKGGSPTGLPTGPVVSSAPLLQL